MEVTEEETMPIFEDRAAVAHAIPPEHSKLAFYKPTAEDAARAKAMINLLMQDRLFLALYRSNDPKARATAMDKLNKAHSQAYSGAPTTDDA
jgi:hypothetical protein